MHLLSSQSNTQSQPPQLARVKYPIIPKYDGRVIFEGNYWNARFYDPGCQVIVLPGEAVQVITKENLTLLVMPIDSGPAPGQQNSGRFNDPRHEATAFFGQRSHIITRLRSRTQTGEMQEKRMKPMHYREHKNS